MNNDNGVDIIALARAAKAKGYGDPQRLAERLQAIIERNADYLAYRARRGRTGAYNEVAREDNEMLAMAVVLLESVEFSENQ